MPTTKTTSHQSGKGDQSVAAALFLEQAAKYLREALENGDNFHCTYTEIEEEAPTPTVRRRLVLEIEAKKPDVW
jgi:hypothetical protein